jgi:hypothetical protein
MEREEGGRVPGRKMGHLSAVGATPDKAVKRVLVVKELL